MVIKDLSSSLLERLRNQSKETGLSYQICLQLFCQEEFLRRLSLSRYKHNFILKGGLFIYTLTKFQSRATQDIDFLMSQLSNDISIVNDIMVEISRVSTLNNYIKIEIMNVETIILDREYHGLTVKLIGLIKQVRIPFSIDIGIDDIIVPNVVLRKLKVRLVDFDEPEVYTYSLESTIAEKFDAILKRMEATSRMKDFFDIYYLSSLFDFDGRLLQKAIWSTIEHRKTTYEVNCFDRIMNFKDNSFLLAQWIRFQPSILIELPKFDKILYRIIEFLKPVFEASINEREFSMKWLSEKSEWNDTFN